jgi:excisionase family DNA binding protein
VKKIRRTEITVDTHRILTVRAGLVPIEGWCSDCGSQVRMLTAEEAAGVRGVSARSIYRWLESGKLHFTEAGSGVLVCINSLFK